MQRLRGRDNGLEPFQMQIFASGHEKPRKGLQRPGVAVEVFRLVSVQKRDVLPDSVRCQLIGREHHTVFEIPLFALRFFLLVLR